MHLHLELRDIHLFLSTVSLKELTGYALNSLSNICALNLQILDFFFLNFFSPFQLTGEEFVDDRVPLLWPSLPYILLP